MQPELQKYYEDRFTMMSSPGWKDLMEDVNNMVKVYSNISNIDNVDSFWKNKGYLEMLIWLQNLKQVSEMAYEDLMNEENL